MISFLNENISFYDTLLHEAKRGSRKSSLISYNRLFVFVIYVRRLSTKHYGYLKYSMKTQYIKLINPELYYFVWLGGY